jgi:hypothetical protein
VKHRAKTLRSVFDDMMYEQGTRIYDFSSQDSLVITHSVDIMEDLDRFEVRECIHCALRSMSRYTSIDASSAQRK